MRKEQQKTHGLKILERSKKTNKLGMTPSELFEMIEGRLLVGSVPSYFVVIVLVIIASTFPSVPWVTLPTHLLISLLSVLIAFILLIKWVAMLRRLCAHALADRGEEAIAVAIGAACVCLVLAGLIVLVAAHAAELSVPLLVLLVILPVMLIWQYRHIIFGAREK